ncbi:MAG: MBOAT family protein [Candidatus Poribacteria bacterium]|nr:MBOAT family protein [Candidatus Poribacteria bacterium]
MVFSSHIFVYYFLPIALLSYYLLPRQAKHLGLTLLSYLFYGWANPPFVLLMFASTVVDYMCGRVIYASEDYRRRKLALTISICSNLSLLGFFKYFNFGVSNFNSILEFLGLPILESVLAVTLPLGISFYTFQSMSYTIDVYRGDGKAIRNFIDFACYVSMFPQLVAGPIIRFSEVAGQLKQRTHTLEKFARGIAFFSLGMVKKILLANPCGKCADTVFDAGIVSTLDAWYGTIAYSFQIYFDFSGYSDMAIGLGLMLGFTFPKNFDSPYAAGSITEFWRKWHISLSSWLRDYLYIPLGGNRKGRTRTYINLALVMLLGGLWHGASWNFVIWGGIHGGMLAIERYRGKTSFYETLPRVLRIVLTFLLVLITWVFFRSIDLSHALTYLQCMFSSANINPATDLVSGILYQPYYLMTMCIAGIVVWSFPQTWDWTQRLTPLRMGVCLLLFIVSLAVLSTQAYNPFIYFIF